jgi:hypothetical protein
MLHTFRESSTARPTWSLDMIESMELIGLMLFKAMQFLLLHPLLLLRVLQLYLLLLLLPVHLQLLLSLLVLLLIETRSNTSSSRASRP